MHIYNQRDRLLHLFVKITLIKNAGGTCKFTSTRRKLSEPIIGHERELQTYMTPRNAYTSVMAPTPLLKILHIQLYNLHVIFTA